MIPGWAGWALGAFAAGFTVAWVLLPLVIRRHPALPWPQSRRILRKHRNVRGR
jgi:hypothetical protein